MSISVTFIILCFMDNKRLMVLEIYIDLLIRFFWSDGW